MGIDERVRSGYRVRVDRADRPPLAAEAAESAAEEQLLRVTVCSTPEAMVVGAVGEIDLLTAGRLRAALLSAVTSPDRRPGGAVVCDLSGVRFLGSPGVGVLAAVVREAIGPLRIVCKPGSAVQRVLQLSGVDQLLEVHDSLASATGADD